MSNRALAALTFICLPIVVVASAKTFPPASHPFTIILELLTPHANLFHAVQLFCEIHADFNVLSAFAKHF